MHEMRLSLGKAENEAKANFINQQKSDGSLRLPWIGDVEARCDAFTLKANHVLISLRAMAKLFYPDTIKTKWIDSLLTMAMTKYGPNHVLTETLKTVSPFMFVVMSTRNSVEHPDPPRMCVRVTDFEFLSDMKIAPPMIEVAHPTSPIPRMPVGAFMLQFIEGLVTSVELFIAALCHSNAPNRGP